MQVPWTMHVPQAMQRHGASRNARSDAAESTALAELKSQSALENQAEDAASLLRPAVPPSSV
jgi:hypothetical protein